MILHINTKEQNKISVALLEGKAGSVKGKAIKTLSAKNKYGSQVLLPLLKRLLRITNYELKSIEVETGSGSFTGLRVGVAVANALGYSLGIPVNGKKLETDLLY